MDIKSLLIGEAIAGGGDTPTGKKEITTTNEVNVASYAKAQVVDSDLVAGNIKKDVNILGITGTYEPTPIQPSLTNLEATENGTYTHTGYDGYDEVVVAVPQPTGNINITDTSSTNVSAYATAQVVDSDLVAGNIKKDVNILGVVGTYEAGGSTPNLTDLTATINGTYTHSGYDGYDEVVVNVPNSYVAGDEGKVVSNGALVSQSSTTKNANGTYDTTLNNEVVVNVANSYTSGDEGKVVSSGALVAQTSTTKNANGTYDTTLNNSITVAVPEPSGNINITDMQSTNVSAYATAQVVDADLVAGNIKKDVNILGVVGTYEASGGGSTTIELATTNATSFNYYGQLNHYIKNNSIDTISCLVQQMDLTNAFYCSTSNQYISSTDQIFDWSFLALKNDYSDSTPIWINCTQMYQDNATLQVPLSFLGKFAFSNMGGMFSNCFRLKRLPANYFANCSLAADKINVASLFANCYQLRELPDLSFLNQHMINGSGTLWYRGLQNCYALDEVLNFPLPDTYGNMQSNNSNMNTLTHIKEFTFATNNGTPQNITQNSAFTIYTSNWGVLPDSQTYIDNSGLPAAKEVSSLASYNSLKDDPDWWTRDKTFSRYNHDSAVNTINSLPNNLGSGTCTIQFDGTMGSGYGKAISDLTNAEIAVATAKGWTVSVQ